ncbi:hypothetical protein AQJ43_23755 [Streptomyces avermitilis]|uniref:Uncharacterized protein n=2 Tax=Streptomyces avermitilis TaxID=33903 RepID=Q82C41_STRAW|nr:MULTISPECIES: hypothetical protein [Streptomyces]KUN52243.1 hypothetical protein AQJ43_23755 [Streptomyces avermitilis]MYT01094.1 hypothetical protein [Streptomyces sp. SID5469]OOV30709.1 hypothetical protein SM007_16015 [Streptomyces avermitilis]BAC73225.1 hypothetical protein SAVERM_5513 [Streptomyces avermitilis MA-4680 = NBRC 14893]BBJ53668.1 hypothetical protein SAVMC3_62970 [Streptomyces avermitilis]
MATFKLTFPYKGRWPGDVVEVRDDEVRDLVQSGIGHLEGAEPVLRLGRLPEVVQPPEAPHEATEAPPEPVKRRGKTSAD